jgi:replicative DNA helicase
MSTEKIMERILNPRPEIKTGIEAIDEELGGLPSGLIVFGARPETDTSRLLIEIADNAAQSGHVVLYLSLRLEPSEVVLTGLQRLTSDLGFNLSIRELISIGRTGHHGNQAALEALDTAAAFYHEEIGDRLYIRRPSYSEATPEGIKELLHEHKNATGKNAGMVVLDGLDFIHAEHSANEHYAEDDTEDNADNLDDYAIDDAVRMLTVMASKLDMPVLASCNATTEKGRAIRMEDYAGTGDIENSAALLFAVDDGQLITLKNRFGETPPPIQISAKPVRAEPH